MLRTILIQAAIFLAPFVAYALVLIATKRPVGARESWTAPVLVWCGGLALVLTLASLLVLSRFGGAPPTATYVPPHMEGGKLVPGQFR